ncbi:glycine cleavage system aminomethyltransferase GcvT [Luteipulveratus sp. YIM 133132]|uniref:aminomethyltransferase n=1 Tax=Luteipulveratus flavus TaxID=3031728 RepID=A0ABT6C5R9_9MICO|nr:MULTISPECIES: glycine cleavage system aminomethyltransferase GcvT [unclassified Luteipulveratus]MDE9366436.1 glycine cleavage system aminomethyltransferase GcvT [Luteipulveratus sp. YIM 133132]MDF8264289.1 glycine cleavage system aminomethyltransferase GcvT [Luteipulveratus sp. YIM 133296]
MTGDPLKTSPLHDRHTALRAKMADFGGWEMPIEYPGGGVLREHTAVRERVGIFDVSHLGKALVKGAGAADFVNSCFTNDLRKVEPPKAQYTMCCDEETGGVVDDLIQYFKAEDEVFLVPNAANTAEVVRRMNAVVPQGISVTDQHSDFGIIAVQGPRSVEVVEALGLPTDLEYMSFTEADWQGRPVIVLRSGYTGEKGFELVPRWEDTPALWDALVEAMQPYDGLPCGLGARDTLRTEMGYALHGHELTMDITPNMARAGWAVGWKKESFWGKKVLEAQRAEKTCRLSWGLLATGRGIPRAECEVKNADGTVIGVVTSGTMSPTLKQGIALVLLDRGAEEGDEVVVDVRGRDVPAKVVKPPFVQVETA